MKSVPSGNISTESFFSRPRSKGLSLFSWKNNSDNLESYLKQTICNQRIPNLFSLIFTSNIITINDPINIGVNTLEVSYFILIPFYFISTHSDIPRYIKLCKDAKFFWNCPKYLNILEQIHLSPGSKLVWPHQGINSQEYP